MTPRGHRAGAGPGTPAAIVYPIFQRDLVRGLTLRMGK
jgi:hypothetical protein